MITELGSLNMLMFILPYSFIIIIIIIIIWVASMMISVLKTREPIRVVCVNMVC